MKSARIDSISQYVRGLREILPQGEGRAFYAWVLENAKAYTRQETVKQYGKPKACFYNAQMAAVDNDALAYCEGWGTIKSFGIPFQHGWNITPEGKVYDPTWKDGAAYYGVIIPTEFVARQMVKTGRSQDYLYQYYKERTAAK